MCPQALSTEANFDRGRYASAWRRYKILRLLFLLLAIGWFPFAFAVITLLPHQETVSAFSYSAMLSWFLIALWVLAACVVGTMRVLWPCPRCGKLFRGFSQLTLPKQCVHCGLPRWVNPAESATPKN
jgi:hypothetical protein